MIPEKSVGYKPIIWPSLNGPTVLENGDGVIPSRPYSTRKSVLKGGVAFCVPATAVNGVAVDSERGLRVRYLTPRECLRLMGMKDDAIDSLMTVETSKTHQYKLAGNSIVVDVLMALFKGIYVDRTFRVKSRTLEDFL